jgi:hypothetical protein
LDAFCRRHGIRFLNLRPAFARAAGSGPALFLPRDGHFSARGARLAAEVLAEYVTREETGLR